MWAWVAGLECKLTGLMRGRFWRKSFDVLKKSTTFRSWQPIVQEGIYIYIYWGYIKGAIIGDNGRENGDYYNGLYKVYIWCSCCSHLFADPDVLSSTCKRGLATVASTTGSKLVVTGVPEKRVHATRSRCTFFSCSFRLQTQQLPSNGGLSEKSFKQHASCSLDSFGQPPYAGSQTLGSA